MKSLQDLPVLILAYNRYEKFYHCINTLKKQGIKKIFLSIDGPKNIKDKKIQEKIYNYCKNNKSDFEIKINQFKNNYGCRLGPRKGISWFFLQNDFGVVLEDDVIVSKQCMESFSFLLKKYQNNANFMSITSFNEFTNKNLESVYKLPVWRSWGWASWSDKWTNHLVFSEKIKNFSIWELYKLLPENLRSIQTAKLVKASQLNLLDAWDYEFNFSHVVNKKSSLTIGGINNFVYGFDNTATHTIDIESLGINFNYFCEREIDLNSIKKLSLKKEKFTLRKCGFFYKKEIFLYYEFLNFLLSLYIPIIFHLRKIKRIMYKTL